METKNLILSLPKSIWEIIDKDLSELGNNKSERIQNIVICSLSTNKDFSKYNKGYNYADIYDMRSWNKQESLFYYIISL